MRQFTSECNLTKEQDTQIIIKINEAIREYTAGNNKICIPFGIPKLKPLHNGGNEVTMLMRVGDKRVSLKFNITQ